VLIENAKRNAHKIPAAGKGKQSRDDFSSLSKELKYILTATELLNEDPYKNWLVEIEIANPDEIGELMDVEAYKKHVEEEENAH